MVNLVAAAFAAEGEDQEWIVNFSPESALSGPVTSIGDDVYRIANGNREFYFHASQVLYMTKRYPMHK